MLAARGGVRGRRNTVRTQPCSLADDRGGCRQRPSWHSRRTASSDEDPAQLREARASGVQLHSPRHYQVRSDARPDHRRGLLQNFPVCINFNFMTRIFFSTCDSQQITAVLTKSRHIYL